MVISFCTVLSEMTIFLFRFRVRSRGQEVMV